MQTDRIPCACGCGTLIVPVSRWGRPRRFVSGHNARLVINWPKRPRTPLADRLWAKVVKGDGCWPFMGHRGVHGHGQIGGEDGRLIGAHRAAWLLTYGPIPAGLYVCHACDNPPCCNPSHLFLGTPFDNNDDMTRKGRRRNPGVKGQAHGCAKLTEVDVRTMRRLRDEGWIYARLAERFGVTIASAQRICTRKSWGHID